MLTSPIMTLSGFFSLSNFIEFVSFSDLMLFRMYVFEIYLQSFMFKISELLGESKSPKFVCVLFFKNFQQKEVKTYK